MALTALLVHERYTQPGGEDVAYEADAALLEAAGHRVVRYERHNDEIATMGPGQRLLLPSRTVWSPSSARAFGQRLDEVRPDVVHLHNTFPLLSPSLAMAAHRRAVPVVQTVQNLRLVCAQGLCTRDGLPCHDCLDLGSPWPALRHACYRGSRAQTAVVVAWQAAQRVAEHRRQPVSLYLPVSAYVRDQLVAQGAVPAGRTMVRHNHVPDPGARRPADDEGVLVFCGRVVRDKGVDVLVRAAAMAPAARIVIVGGGPDLPAMAELSERHGATNVTFTGPLTRAEALAHVRRARCVVAPSVCEDPNPLSLIEAAALGVAAIATTSGGIPEIVGDTGMLCPPADAEALSAALADAAGDATGWAGRGLAARARYEMHFSATRAYEVLLDAYRRAGVRDAAATAEQPEVSPATGPTARPGPGAVAAR
ncbi:MAG TPA: glycosyltransferase family 4 protein [Acidimicrobiales bacterium]|nr:glycosyltransferase family 4 protein [Acidimicrobiales bacterium]